MTKQKRTVWIVMYSIEYEGGEFKVAAESVEAAKKRCPDNLKWKYDPQTGEYNAKDGPIGMYHIFETNVVT